MVLHGAAAIDISCGVIYFHMFYAALQQSWSRKKCDFFQFTLSVSVNAISVNFGISCYFGSDCKTVAAKFLKL